MTEKHREWLTKGEIESVVHSEMRDALVTNNASFDKIQDALNKQNAILDKVADGAQAQILSATILHGSPGIGLKGVLPDLKERVDVIESDLIDIKRVDSERWEKMSAQFDSFAAGQGRIWRGIKKLCNWIGTTEGKPDYRRVVAFGAACGTAVHYLLNRFPGWAMLRDWILRIVRYFYGGHNG